MDSRYAKLRPMASKREPSGLPSLHELRKHLGLSFLTRGLRSQRTNSIGVMVSRESTAPVRA